MKNILPAGTYYIGDLCYIFDSDFDFWSDICEIYHNKCQGQTVFEYKLNEPYVKDRSVAKFAMMRTKWGDGEYYGYDDNIYCVDSGTIGCVEVQDYESITGEVSSTFFANQLFVFDKEFEVYSDDGILHFGHIVIDTKVKKDWM